MTNPRTSIAVIGGGVSGLVFAHRLAQRGFERVVVFERNAEVGGKSCTVDIDGRPHDLGATMGVPIDYRNVVAVSRAAGIATEPFPREQHYSLARGGPVALNRRRELPRVLAEAARYVRLARGWRVGHELHRAPRELFAPWSELVARHGLAAANQRMLCYRAGYGYGFDDEVPGVMYANLVRPSTLLGLATSDAFMWTGGTQSMWIALARRLEGNRVEIRRATAVSRIARTSEGVIIDSIGVRDWSSGSRHAADGTSTCDPPAGMHREHFDKLVIACNPRDLADALDAGPERDWSEHVRTYPYATFACEIEGLATGRASVGYCDDNMRRDRMGHPMAWVKRYADRDIYVCHLYAPAALSDADITRRIADDMARLGGRLVAVRDARRWQFFPHFTSAFMQAGGLAAIDRWQGTRHTYLIGEVLSFATMARCAELAATFAERVACEPSTAVTVEVPRGAPGSPHQELAS